MTTEKQRTVVYLNSGEREALERIKIKTGAPVGELIRRAIAEWLKTQKAGRK